MHLRITYFHLVMSFFVLAAFGFLSYRMFGRPSPFVPPPSYSRNVPAVRPPVATPPPPSASPNARSAAPVPVAPPVEEAPSREVLGYARAMAWAAIQDAARLSPGAEELRRAQALFNEARGLSDYETVRSLAASVPASAPRNAPSPPDRYVVRPGDTLWSIAKKRDVYGRGAGWVKIWRANERDIPDFDRIVSGQELEIPRR